jgi:hypothetical protein
MKLKKGTPLEFITAVLSRLGVVNEYKDYLMEAYELYAEQRDAGVPDNEIMARFIAIKENDPKFDKTKEAVMDFLKKRREANQFAAKVLKEIADKGKK